MTWRLKRISYLLLYHKDKMQRAFFVQNRHERATVWNFKKKTAICFPTSISKHFIMVIFFSYLFTDSVDQKASVFNRTYRRMSEGFKIQ